MFFEIDDILIRIYRQCLNPMIPKNRNAANPCTKPKESSSIIHVLIVALSCNPKLLLGCKARTWVTGFCELETTHFRGEKNAWIQPVMVAMSIHRIKKRMYTYWKGFNNCPQVRPERRPLRVCHLPVD